MLVERQKDWESAQSRRRGLSLTEVLIAMGILTLGLLGVTLTAAVGVLDAVTEGDAP